MNDEQNICKQIGVSLKDLRVKNGYSSYENFALEHELSRMQYWRIEKGLTNITIRSLIKILNIHGITLSEFCHALNRRSASNGANGRVGNSNGSNSRGRKFQNNGRGRKK